MKRREQDLEKVFASFRLKSKSLSKPGSRLAPDLLNLQQSQTGGLHGVFQESEFVANI